MEERTLARIAAGLWLVACLLGTLARVAGTWELVLHGDEPIAVELVARGYGAILASFDGRGSHAGFVLLQRASVDVFGWSAGAYRLPSVVAGVLALWLLYPLARPLAGAGPAWLATLLLAGNALHVYHSRNGRPYALAFLLVLVLLFAVQRGLSGGRGARRAWIAVALVSGVLPWVHLTAAGPVAAVALASLAWTWRAKGDVRPCLRAFGAGALLCALLYAPAAPELVRYVGGLSEPARAWRVDWSGVLGVIGGTPALGWGIAVGGSAGLVALALRARPCGFVLAAAGLAPFAVLALAEPRGSQVAGARYLLIGLGPLLLGAAALVFRLARGRAWLAGAAGLAVVALQLVGGPLDRTWYAGSLASAPELLESRYALAPPHAGTPVFYAELAREPRGTTIAEYPITALGALLLRNYALQHGQRVLVGTDGGGPPLYSVDPYVPLIDLAALRHRADWLVVHLDLPAETERFRRVAGLPRVGQRAPLFAGAAEQMLQALGEPTYRDDFVWAWRLERERDAAASGGLISSPR